MEGSAIDRDRWGSGPVGQIAAAINDVASALGTVPAQNHVSAALRHAVHIEGGPRAPGVGGDVGFFDGVEADGAGGGPVATLFHAVILAANDVGISGLKLIVEGDEVGVDAAWILRRDAPATIGFIEIKVRALGVAEIAQVIEVLKVPADGKGGAHRRSGGGIVGRADSVSRANRPLWQGGATGSVQIGGAEVAIARNETRLHAADAAAGIVGNTVAIGAVDGVAVEAPAENRAVCRRSGGLGVGVGGRIVVHVIAQFMAEGEGADVVMAFTRERLVRTRRIKGGSLGQTCVSCPVLGATRTVVDVGAAIPVEGVELIVDDGIVHPDRDGAKVGVRLGDGRLGAAREAGEHVPLAGQIDKDLRLGVIKVPRPHRVVGKGGAFDINPVGTDADARDPGVGGDGLTAIAHGSTRQPGGVGEAVERAVLRAVDAGILSTHHRLPRGLDRFVQNIRRCEVGGELGGELFVGLLGERRQRAGEKIALLIGIGREQVEALGAIVEADELVVPAADRFATGVFRQRGAGRLGVGKSWRGGLVLQQRHETGAVDGLHGGLSGGDRDARHLKDSGIEVDRLDEVIDLAVWRDDIGAADEQRDAHAAFVEGVFPMGGSERLLHNLGWTAVVADEDDPGIGPRGGREAAQEATDLGV